MGIAEAKADIQLARDLIASAQSVDEIRSQLLDNVLPLLGGICDATIEELAKRDEVLQTVADDIDNLIDQSDDMLQPETAAQILALLEVGKLLCDEMDRLLAKKQIDEVTKKRITTLLRQYKKGHLVVGAIITEITIPVEPEESEKPAAATGGDVEIKSAGAADSELDDDDLDDDDDDCDDDDVAGGA